MEPPWHVGKKFYINGSGHMNKMAVTPKWKKNLLLQNQKNYDLESWYAASGTQALQIYINDDPRLTVTYFTASKWVAYMFKCEKLLPSLLMGKHAAKD